MLRRYMIAVEHSAIMEEIEIEDAHRLDPGPTLAGGAPLPAWIRAVYKIQENFDALNERGWRPHLALWRHNPRILLVVPNHLGRSPSFLPSLSKLHADYAACAGHSPCMMALPAVAGFAGFLVAYEYQPSLSVVVRSAMQCT